MKILDQKKKSQASKYSALALTLITVAAIVLGFVNIRLDVIGLPLGLISGALFLILLYSVTDLKLPLSGIAAVAVIIGVMGYLSTIEILSPQITMNIAPVLIGTIGGGLIGLLLLMPNARYKKRGN